MKRVLVILLVLWVGGLAFSHHNPAVQTGLANTSHEGGIGGILMALVLCLPIAGAFYMVRTHFRWQRLLHHRLKVEGLSFRRPGDRP